MCLKRITFRRLNLPFKTMSDRKSDLINPAYWVGHSFAVIATIVGVYLAASVGFKKAVELELLRADRGTYYLAQSLLSQTQANLENFEEVIEKTEGKNIIAGEVEKMHLNDFVYESAKFSDSTFELEPEVLTEISQFYSNLQAAFDAYYPEKPRSLLNAVKVETDKVKDGPLQRLEEHVAELHDLCERQGLEL